MRLHNPLNQQMIDIWDQAIMLIEERYNEWVYFMYRAAADHTAEGTEHQFAMEMTNTRDYLRSLSWYILQWAAIPEDSDQYEGIAESARMLIETQKRQTDFVHVNLMKDILKVADNLEDPHDLTDFAFMIYQLYQICRWLLMFENVNPDRIRVAMELEILNGITNNSSRLLNVNVKNTFALSPQPANRQAHALTEEHKWHDIMMLWPPVGYQWMSFWRKT